MAIRLLGTTLAALILLYPVFATGEDSVGKQIYFHCKNCHGASGEGGKDGKYPRIAGMPQDYVERQLNNFKLRKRINKPMVPIFKNWRFDDDAISLVAAYVHQLPESAPIPFEPSAELLADFDSREEFDELGRDIFDENCAQCHGDNGRGRADKEAPPLVNQYPNYIRKQIDDFIEGRREHEHAEKMFGELYEEEIDALLSHLGTMSNVPSGVNTL